MIGGWRPGRGEGLVPELERKLRAANGEGLATANGEGLKFDG